MKKMINFKDICDKNYTALKNQYKIIGVGSSRVVFDIHSKYVLKKAKKSIRGELQTKQEIYLYEDMKSLNRLCPIIYSSKTAIIAAKAIPLNTPYKLLPNMIIRNKIRQFRKTLSDIRIIWDNKNNPRLDKRVPNWKKIKSSKLYQDIECLINSYDLCAGDLWRNSHWGYYRGYFVIIDYGTTSEMINEYYK